MKKRALILFVIGIAASLIFIMSGSQVHARVTGACGSCHTMHNSQDGASVRGGTATAQSMASPECATCHASVRPDSLLKMDCVGCHASAPGNPAQVVSGAPQVAHSNAADLAAGNFKHVFGGNDSRGHNVHGFWPSIGMEMNIIPPSAPPGYDASLDYGGWTPSGSTQNPLMCAGTNGCHGNRAEIVPLKAVKGAHHTDDSVLKFGSINQAAQGSTVGTSYRFLLGVQGGEDSDWEQTFNKASDHNEYVGVAWGARGGDPRTTHSISSLCSTCHGAFHAASGVGTGTSPWVRHPTDLGMKTTGEFSTYTYENDTPVARESVPNTPNDVVDTEAKRVVMCLSCHRPHASANDDALRFKYDATMTSPSGCYNCLRNK